MDDLLQALQAAGIRVEHEVSARRLSTFAAGGMVSHYVLPATPEQLQRSMQLLSSTHYHVLGGGSNTLVGDFGLQWVIGTRALLGIRREGTFVECAAGEMLPNLAKFACANGLAGVEFACGIPGTVGGALRMNAGAYGQDMSQTVQRAVVVTAEGICTVDKQQLQLRYRASSIVGVVASVTFALRESSPEEVERTQQDMQAARHATQPHQASLGCVFKAAGGVPAAKYIVGCGLRGTKIGQAQVSGVHANFIVNMGGATARDYLRLVDVVKKAVYERYGVNLQEEFVHMHD